MWWDEMEESAGTEFRQHYYIVFHGVAKRKRM